MGIAEALGAIFGGGLTGLLGSLVNTIGDYFKAKQQYAHDEKMAEIETKHLEMEINRDVIVAKEEATARMEEAEARVQEASYEADERKYLPSSAVKQHIVVVILMAIVDFVRGMTRPGLTIYLCIVTTWLASMVFKIWGASGGTLDQEQAFELIQIIVLGILYVTFTAIGWWFGSRSKFKDIIAAKMS